MKLLGSAPIHPVLFVVAKAALVPPFLFLPVAAAHARAGALAFPRMAPVARFGEAWRAYRARVRLYV